MSHAVDSAHFKIKEAARTGGVDVSDSGLLVQRVHFELVYARPVDRQFVLCFTARRSFQAQEKHQPSFEIGFLGAGAVFTDAAAASNSALRSEAIFVQNSNKIEIDAGMDGHRSVT